MTQITKTSRWPIPLIAWSFYDWGSSAVAAIIQTFIYAAYFTGKVAANETVGAAQWGCTVGLAGLCVGILGPILGAVADQGEQRRPWLISFTLVGVLSTMAMWFVTPDSSHVTMALVLLFLAVVGTECASVFYNSLLPVLASKEDVGRWSGWAWGLGYIGGMLSLILSFVLLMNDHGAIFHLKTKTASAVRATFVLAGVWYLIFSLPLLFTVRDPVRKAVPIGKAIKEGLQQLVGTFREMRKYKAIALFLVAHLFYIDALITIFAFGGLYATGVFHLSAQEVLLFGIALNVTAGIGSIAFAWVDDWIGSKRTILLSILGVIIPTIFILFIDSVPWFWVCGMITGVFVGPVQAASRSMLARMAPEELSTEFFGFFALSGRATSFMGPFLVSWLTYLFDSQRVGMSSVLLFLVIGGVLLLFVKETPAKAPVRS